MIENFSSLNPNNFNFKIFIKKRSDSTWIPAKYFPNWVTGDKYVYDVYKNNLWVYAQNEEIVDVQITY